MKSVRKLESKRLGSKFTIFYVLFHFIISLIVLPTSIFSEENQSSSPSDYQLSGNRIEESPSWVPIGRDGEPSIDEAVNLQAILNYKAQSRDLSIKMSALNELDALYDEGLLSKYEKKTIEIIEIIALEGTTSKLRYGNLNAPSFPTARLSACKLLGKIGGSQAEQILITILNHESEVLVLGQAMLSLAAVVERDTGEMKDNEIIDLFARTIKKIHHRSPDNSFAISAINAVSILDERFGGLKDPELFSSLLLLLRGEYVYKVKKAASVIITKMRKN